MRQRSLPWTPAALRERLRSIAAAVGDTRAQVVASQDEARRRFDDLERKFDWVAEHATAPAPPPPPAPPAVDEERLLDAIRLAAEDEPRAREALWRLRADPAYEAAYTEAEPLVSVVIPTYDQAELLRDRALPSVLEQTYDRLEVIVVGDAASPDTRRAVEAVGDPRVRFHDLPVRGPYPEDPAKRWLVAGVPPYNAGVRMARGRWIAPLDDDDAFHPDHVERLLRHARSERAELSYGRYREHHPGGGVRSSEPVFPPAAGEFGLQCCVYHAGLAPIFELELADAVWGEPYDWGLVRRMLRAGVRVAMLDEEVVHYYPSQLWRKAEDAPEPRHEFEAIGPAWDEAQAEGGWDVEAVARSYARKWPAFVEATSGPDPLGVAHEVPEGAPMRRDDAIAQTTILAFGHVLAQAAHRAERLRVLDWGGALGHYHLLAQRLLGDVELDWTVRELPAVCAAGREVNPAVRFVEDEEEALAGSYDLVMASGALQYGVDWRALLGRLAGAASDRLFISRLPVVRRHDAFVTRQRAHAYGYDTAYLGWVLNRDEVVGAAEDAEFELVREYLLQPPMQIAGAPEDAEHVGLAFRRRAA